MCKCKQGASNSQTDVLKGYRGEGHGLLAEMIGNANCGKSGAKKNKFFPDMGVMTNEGVDAIADQARTKICPVLFKGEAPKIVELEDGTEIKVIVTPNILIVFGEEDESAHLARLKFEKGAIQVESRKLNVNDGTMQ